MTMLHARRSDAIDTVFKRMKLEQRFNIEGLRLATLPSTLTIQGRVGRAPAFFDG